MTSAIVPVRPEVLAPAGDEASLRAAALAGADAVYFGLPGLNARARATNFDEARLGDTMAFLHERGVRGYVALNTLVFDAELPLVERAVRAAAAAGVDAVIVQDLGVLRLVRAIAPGLPVHASTQMTCTDAASVELARELGASRVILARELSLAEIGAIAAASRVELEVFVHGALCVAYSGQCLTSEAIGGRSANRGACAQACRLPYELVVDGVKRELGDRAHLLSPEDLEASALVPRLVELGVASLKIEGRLKGPDYVAATVRLYRAAIDAATANGPAPAASLRRAALQAYSRGSGPGFLAGVDHQRLVEGRGCDHRGLLAGTCLAIEAERGRSLLRIRLEADLARGDGLRVEGGLASAGEVGGRVWTLGEELRDRDGSRWIVDRERSVAGTEVLAWLGPERDRELSQARGELASRRVWKTSDPASEKAVLAAIEREPHRRAIDVRVSGAFGERPRFAATTRSGLSAACEGDAPIEIARAGSAIEGVLRDKLGRLGDTPFSLGALAVALPEGALIAPASLNRARRTLVEGLLASARRSHETTSASHEGVATVATAALASSTARPPSRDPSTPADDPPRLFALCRSLVQAEAALDAGADGVYLDLLELTGTGAAVRALRARGAPSIGVAPPRIRKPGEEKVDRYLESLAPDAILVRGLGALRDLSAQNDDNAEDGRSDAIREPRRIGDFSLNATNRLAAHELLSRGLAAFTPSFDLDGAQLLALLDGPLAPFAEVVVHHPMPLFHMEHCVFAALLSSGHDHRDCGRPCERHEVALRDRAGLDHPVVADVGCRNTVFHAAAQSGAGLVAGLRARGVRRFRVELVRESPSEVARVVSAYRGLLRGAVRAGDVWRSLRAESAYGVVRGSLRVLDA